MTTWRVPKESTEWVGPITVTVDDDPVTAFEVALMPAGSRPVEDDWAAPTELEGDLGVLLAPETSEGGPTRFTVWARVTANPEIPVLDNVVTVWRT